MECTLFRGGPTGLRIIIPQQQIRMDTFVEADSISITTTHLRFGGRRFWFQCECGRRCGRLYLPPGQHVFRCRICNNLTYRSAQEHDQREYDLARNLSAMMTALQSKKTRRRLLGVGAMTLNMKWSRRKAGRKVARQGIRSAVK